MQNPQRGSCPGKG